MDKKTTKVFAVTVGTIAIAVAVLILALTFTLQQPHSTAFTAKDNFTVPEHNGNINFAAGGRYGSAYYENYTYPWSHGWQFIDLYLGNSPFVQTNPTSRVLMISAQNCNVTITGYDQTENNPVSGQLNYTVIESGNQTLNLGGIIENIVVHIDGVAKSQNDGWVMNEINNWITITDAKSN